MRAHPERTRCSIPACSATRRQTSGDHDGSHVSRSMSRSGSAGRALLVSIAWGVFACLHGPNGSISYRI